MGNTFLEVFFLKKFFWVFWFMGLSFVFVSLTVGVLWWDYAHNNRIFYAKLHTVTLSSYQEEMRFSSPVTKHENLFLMSGSVRKIDNISVGAVATVTVGGSTYNGTLWRLEPTFDGIYYATVFIDGLKQIPKEDATAVILGNLRQNVILIPKECLTTDQAGQDAVFVVQNGYAALRRVRTADVSKNEMQQILEGVLPSETLIISPAKIRTGDRIFPP